MNAVLVFLGASLVLALMLAPVLLGARMVRERAVGIVIKRFGGPSIQLYAD